MYNISALCLARLVLTEIVFSDEIIEGEREKERQRKKEIARLTHYSKILLRMKERLWKEQSVFKRTMETYQNAMTAQSEEQRDIADTFRKVRYWKVCTTSPKPQLCFLTTLYCAIDL